MVATWWVIYYANGANPDGQKGVARLPYLPECNPRYPVTPAMPASQSSTVSHPPCTFALVRQSFTHWEQCPDCLDPGLDFDRAATTPFHWPVRDAHLFVHPTSSSNSASLWLNPHKSYNVTRHAARSLCDQLF